MPLLNGELARRQDGQLDLRLEPTRLQWSLNDLTTSDGHTLQAVFSCAVRPLTQPAERQMLEEVFLNSSQVLRVERVVAHFYNAFRAAASAACQQKSAAEIMSDDGNAAVSAAIRTAGNRLAFTCGLELMGPFQLDLQSPTLERQRLESMQRKLTEQRSAGQLEHLQHSAELLRAFEEIRKSSPNLSPGEILRQVAPADQGMMLQTLLLASGKQTATETIWAAAGQAVLRINPQADPPTALKLELPATLGPLRSIQPASRPPMLLAGARSGVWFFDPAAPADARAYSDPGMSSQLGFSRAVLWNEGIWACHGEAGIIAWKLDQADTPALALRPADLAGAAPRNLQALDDERLIFSTKNRLVVLARREDGLAEVAAPPSADEASDEIIAILPDGRRLIVVLRNGMVQVRDLKSLAIVTEDKRCDEPAAAALLPWLGSTRLLLAPENGAVLCIGLEDELVSQYASKYPGMRALAATTDLIVGLSADRQRIVFWQSWNRRQPVGEVFVPSLTHHRAADIDV